MNLFSSMLLLLLLCMATQMLNPAGLIIPVYIDATEQKGLNSRVADFVLSNQTIFDGVSELNSQAVPLAFGFEQVLKQKFRDPTVPDPSISLSIKDATVREVLDSLCKADGRYTWSEDGSTINVYPVKTVDDPSYLLNRQLVRVQISRVTDIQQGLLSIAQQLPPPREQIAHVQIGGSTAYPVEPWTTSLENVTVRQALNRLAGHMGEHSAWLFYGANEFRAFSFYQFGFRKPLKLRPNASN